MDDLLAEGLLDGVTAAVGDGGDGSDDDATSDDFLSWLLVHADTIDPKLDEYFVNPDDAVTDGSASPLLNATGVAAPGAGIALADRSAAIAGRAAPDTVAPGYLSALPADTTLTGTSKTTDDLPNIDQVGLGQGESAAAAAAAATVAVVRDQVPHEASVAGTGELLRGSLMGPQGIPADPVLAMHMGAQMALTGNISHIPFGMALGRERADGSTPTAPVAGEGPGAATQAPVPFPDTPVASPAAVATAASSPAPAQAASARGVAIQNSAPALAVSAAYSLVGTSAPPATQAPTVLPAWTGLPHPPLWLGGKQQPQVSLSKSSAVSVDDPLLTAGGVGLERSAAIAEAAQPMVASRQEGAWSGSIGEKRPRGPEAPKEETAAGGRPRETFKDGRKKKKMSLGELEELVKQVSEDNARMKLHLSNVNEKIALMAHKKKLMEAEIAAKVEAQRSVPNDFNEANLAEALSRFKDLYADYGKHRKEEVEFHLKQLERQIVPTDTTKMSLWTLEQDESFYKDRKRDSLSLILRTELGVSEEQINRIQQRRERIKSLLDDLGESLQLVQKLHKSSEAKNIKFEEVMARLQSAFSPHQVARLLLWVSANRGHISKLPLLPKHMLHQHFSKKAPL